MKLEKVDKKLDNKMKTLSMSSSSGIKLSALVRRMGMAVIAWQKVVVDAQLYCAQIKTQSPISPYISQKVPDIYMSN